MSSSKGLVAHQFDDPAQQTETARLGMWTFLLTEIMFFGGLIAGYVVYRLAYPEAFALASRHLDVVLGGVNTAVLILSSLTMALAVQAAEARRRSRLVPFLVLTAALGGVFLVIKGVEYHHKFEEHLLPGATFSFPGELARGPELFFSFYFAMTGVHALHMVIGIGVVAVLLASALLRRARPVNANSVEMAGLYWHFVDIVWIFLFPLLYLIGRHG